MAKGGGGGSKAGGRKPRNVRKKESASVLAIRKAGLARANQAAIARTRAGRAGPGEIKRANAALRRTKRSSTPRKRRG